MPDASVADLRGVLPWWIELGAFVALPLCWGALAPCAIGLARRCTDRDRPARGQRAPQLDRGGGRRWGGRGRSSAGCGAT
jgi:hypothetical protein